jgi:hypothetical protein
MAPQAAFVPPCIAHDRAPGQIQGVMAANSPLVEPAAIDEPDLDVIGLDGPIGPSEAIVRRIEADKPPAALLRPASPVLPPGDLKRASRYSVRRRLKPWHRRRSATEGAIRATQRGLLVRSLTGCGVFLTMAVRYLMFRSAGGFSDLA